MAWGLPGARVGSGSWVEYLAVPAPPAAAEGDPDEQVKTGQKQDDGRDMEEWHEPGEKGAEDQQQADHQESCAALLDQFTTADGAFAGVAGSVHAG
jgi:hypothetical protein